jgi:hypothetical protein
MNSYENIDWMIEWIYETPNPKNKMNPNVESVIEMAGDMLDTEEELEEFTKIIETYK